MQRILSIIAVGLCTCAVSAQITLTTSSFPVAGDTLRIAFDTTAAGITVSAPGGNQVWDFSTLMPHFVRVLPVKPAAQGQQAAAFPNATLVVPTGLNGENYYRVTSNQYQLIGFAGTDPAGFGINVITPFNPPIVERRAPMNFFDINQTNGALLVPFAGSALPQALLNLLPIVPDSIRLKVTLSRVDVVDGWGTLTIPGGTYPVLRERRTQYTDTRIEIKVGVFPWTDITSLIQLPGAALGRDTSLSYYFFSNMAKEPIAVLEANHVTQAVLSAQFKYNDLTRVALGPDVNALVRVFPNPTIEEVRIEWHDLPAGVYEWRLTNLAGQVVGRQRLVVAGSGVGGQLLNLQGLVPGVYVYTLTDVGGQWLHTGKLLVER